MKLPASACGMPAAPYSSHNHYGSIWMCVRAWLQGLRAADQVFGHEINSKGYKVIKGAGIIQGDGIDIEVIKKVSTAIGRIRSEYLNTATITCAEYKPAVLFCILFCAPDVTATMPNCTT